MTEPTPSPEMVAPAAEMPMRSAESLVASPDGGVAETVITEVGGFVVSIESEISPLAAPIEVVAERTIELSPEVAAPAENDAVSGIAPVSPEVGLTVLDVPLNLPEEFNTRLQSAGLFVAGHDAEPLVRTPRPAEGTNDAGRIEYELAA